MISFLFLFLFPYLVLGAEVNNYNNLQLGDAEIVEPVDCPATCPAYRAGCPNVCYAHDTLARAFKVLVPASSQILGELKAVYYYVPGDNRVMQALALPEAGVDENSEGTNGSDRQLEEEQEPLSDAEVAKGVSELNLDDQTNDNNRVILAAQFSSNVVVFNNAKETFKSWYSTLFLGAVNSSAESTKLIHSVLNAEQQQAHWKRVHHVTEYLSKWETLTFAGVGVGATVARVASLHLKFQHEEVVQRVVGLRAPGIEHVTKYLFGDDFAGFEDSTVKLFSAGTSDAWSMLGSQVLNGVSTLQMCVPAASDDTAANTLCGGDSVDIVDDVNYMDGACTSAVVANDSELNCGAMGDNLDQMPEKLRTTLTQVQQAANNFVLDIPAFYDNLWWQNQYGVNCFQAGASADPATSTSVLGGLLSYDSATGCVQTPSTLSFSSFYVRFTEVNADGVFKFAFQGFGMESEAAFVLGVDKATKAITYLNDQGSSFQGVTLGTNEATCSSEANGIIVVCLSVLEDESLYLSVGSLKTTFSALYSSTFDAASEPTALNKMVSVELVRGYASGAFTAIDTTPVFRFLDLVQEVTTQYCVGLFDCTGGVDVSVEEKQMWMLTEDQGAHVDVLAEEFLEEQATTSNDGRRRLSTEEEQAFVAEAREKLGKSYDVVVALKSQSNVYYQSLEQQRTISVGIYRDFSNQVHVFLEQYNKSIVLDGDQLGGPQCQLLEDNSGKACFVLSTPLDAVDKVQMMLLRAQDEVAETYTASLEFEVSQFPNCVLGADEAFTITTFGDSFCSPIHDGNVLMHGTYKFHAASQNRDMFALSGSIDASTSFTLSLYKIQSVVRATLRLSGKEIFDVRMGSDTFKCGYESTPLLCVYLEAGRLGVFLSQDSMRLDVIDVENSWGSLIENSNWIPASIDDFATLQRALDVETCTLENCDGSCAVDVDGITQKCYGNLFGSGFDYLKFLTDEAFRTRYACVPLPESFPGPATKICARVRRDGNICALETQFSDESFLSSMERLVKVAIHTASGMSVWEPVLYAYETLSKRLKREAGDWTTGCDEIYFTGHSAGGSVAYLLRMLHYNFGRYVGFGTPGVLGVGSGNPFAISPMEQPIGQRVFSLQKSLGDNILLYDDPIVALTHLYNRGLTNWYLCSDSTTIANKFDPRGFSDFCARVPKHKKSRYLSWIAGLSGGDSNSYTVRDTCPSNPAVVERGWIEECLNVACGVPNECGYVNDLKPDSFRAEMRVAGESSQKLAKCVQQRVVEMSPMCPVGRAELRGRLVGQSEARHKAKKFLEMAAAKATDPWQYFRTVMLQEDGYLRVVPQANVGNSGVMTVDVLAGGEFFKKYERQAREFYSNSSLAAVVSQVSNTASATSDKFMSSLEAPLVRFTVRVISGEGSAYTNAGEEKTVDPNKWYLQVMMQPGDTKFLLDPEVCYFCLALESLVPGNSLAGRLVGGKLCFEFDEDKLFATILFGSFSSKIPVLDFDPETLKIQPSSETIEDVLHSESYAVEFTDDVQTQCREAYPQNARAGWCETNTNVRCTSHDSCAFRNAICGEDGFCMCKSNFCSTANMHSTQVLGAEGTCIAASDPNAYQRPGHPCLDESRVVGSWADDDFVVLQDREYGANFDTCYKLGKFVYYRVDYPTAADAQLQQFDSGLALAQKHPQMSFVKGQFGALIPKLGVTLHVDVGVNFGIREGRFLYAQINLRDQPLHELRWELTAEQTASACTSMVAVGMEITKYCTEVIPYEPPRIRKERLRKLRQLDFEISGSSETERQQEEERSLRFLQEVEAQNSASINDQIDTAHNMQSLTNCMIVEGTISAPALNTNRCGKVPLVYACEEGIIPLPQTEREAVRQVACQVLTEATSLEKLFSWQVIAVACICVFTAWSMFFAIKYSTWHPRDEQSSPSADEVKDEDDFVVVDENNTTMVFEHYLRKKNKDTTEHFHVPAKTCDVFDDDVMDDINTVCSEVDEQGMRKHRRAMSTPGANAVVGVPVSRPAEQQFSLSDALRRGLMIDSMRRSWFGPGDEQQEVEVVEQVENNRNEEVAEAQHIDIDLVSNHDEDCGTVVSSAAVLEDGGADTNKLFLEEGDHAATNTFDADNIDSSAALLTKADLLQERVLAVTLTHRSERRRFTAPERGSKTMSNARESAGNKWSIYDNTYMESQEMEDSTSDYVVLDDDSKVRRDLTLEELNARAANPLKLARRIEETEKENQALLNNAVKWYNFDREGSRVPFVATGFRVLFHFLRVMTRMVRLPDFPLLDCEKEPKMEHPYVKHYLAWRRSCLVMYLWVVGSVMAFRCFVEIPDLIDTLITDFKEYQGKPEEFSVQMLHLREDGSNNGDGDSIMADTYLEDGGMRRKLVEKIKEKKKESGSILSKLPFVNDELVDHGFLRWLNEEEEEQEAVAVTTLDMFDNESLRTPSDARLDVTEQMDQAEANMYIIREAQDIRRKIWIFKKFMLCFKMLNVFLTLYLVGCVVYNWNNYGATVGKMRWAAFSRIFFLNVLPAIIPWNMILFADPENRRPRKMDHTVRLYVNMLVMMPLLNTALMFAPSLVSGSKPSFDIFPYSIFPVIVIFVTPLFAVVSLWPLLALIGNLSSSYFILLGFLFYCSNYWFCAAMAARAFYSVEGVAKLGSMIDFSQKGMNSALHSPPVTSCARNPTGSANGATWRQHVNDPLHQKQKQTNIIQAALSANLKNHWNPRVRQALVNAKLWAWCGMACFIVGIWRLSGGLEFENFEEFCVFLTTFMCKLFVMAFECIANKLILQVCCSDLLIQAQVHLRLYNGHMMDDKVLTRFVSLLGYPEKIAQAFQAGYKYRTDLIKKERKLTSKISTMESQGRGRKSIIEELERRVSGYTSAKAVARDHAVAAKKRQSAFAGERSRLSVFQMLTARGKKAASVFW